MNRIVTEEAMPLTAHHKVDRIYIWGLNVPINVIKYNKIGNFVFDSVINLCYCISRAQLLLHFRCVDLSFVLSAKNNETGFVGLKTSLLL